MESLHSFLWTESVPMAFIVMIIIIIEIGGVVGTIAQMRKKPDLMYWYLNPISLMFLLGPMILLSKTEIGCWVLVGFMLSFILVFLTVCFSPKLTAKVLRLVKKYSL